MALVLKTTIATSKTKTTPKPLTESKKVAASDDKPLLQVWTVTFLSGMTFHWLGTRDKVEIFAKTFDHPIKEIRLATPEEEKIWSTVNIEKRKPVLSIKQSPKVSTSPLPVENKKPIPLQLKELKSISSTKKVQSPTGKYRTGQELAAELLSKTPGMSYEQMKPIMLQHFPNSNFNMDRFKWLKWKIKKG